LVELLYQAAAQTDHHLGGLLVPMDGHFAPGLDGVEHAQALILRTVVQVKALPQARIFLRLNRYLSNYVCVIFILET